MASHMLENGSDIRFIQAILGHWELSTTQIYTHVAIGRLKAVQALTHPAWMERTAPSCDEVAAIADVAHALLDVIGTRDDEAEHG